MDQFQALRSGVLGGGARQVGGAGRAGRCGQVRSRSPRSSTARPRVLVTLYVRRSGDWRFAVLCSVLLCSDESG